MVHRAELHDVDRLAVEPHALLAVEHRTARRRLHQQRDGADRNRQQRERAARDDHVDSALHDCIEALQRNVVDVDDRDAVEILEPRPERDDLQQIGHHLHVDALPARRFDQLEHLHVLFGRQRDVKVIDSLARRDLGRLADRAEQRQSAVAEMIARRPVVDEADDLIPELAMLQNLVGDQTPELAGARDENALEADAGAPASLQNFSDELARGIGERHVEDEEDRPDGLRDLERAAALRLGAREIGLDVQRRDDAEHDGENAADEDGEEIVDARSAAPQPIEALQLKAERYERRDERKVLDVLLQRRNAARPASRRKSSDATREKQPATSAWSSRPFSRRTA